MSTVQRIARNTSLLLFSSATGFVIGFLFIMYVACYLGAEGSGMPGVLMLAFGFGKDGG
jgi:O-antigen/teichoic acid export membrane protein